MRNLPPRMSSLPTRRTWEIEVPGEDFGVYRAKKQFQGANAARQAFPYSVSQGFFNSNHSLIVQEHSSSGN